ncbi:hypothetical protein ACFQ2Y_48690 [Streptomyces malaysiensis subsp. malaysiensis]
MAVRKDDRGDDRLVAYVVTDADAATIGAELRDHVERLLPRR